MIYAIRTMDMTAVKFGITKGNPFARLSDLQTGNHKRLVMAAWCESDADDDALESTIHALCGQYHMSGEWFEYNVHTMAIVEAMQLEMKSSHTVFSSWLLQGFSPDLKEDMTKLKEWALRNKPVLVQS